MLGFRVWDSIEKRFVENFRCHMMNYDGSLSSFHDPMLRNIIIYEDRYIPMQSTGLKDCTGVEIFEGDLIKSEHVTFKMWRIVLVENVTDFLQDTPRSGFRYELKILGNQYENPELLSQINKLTKFNDEIPD